MKPIDYKGYSIVQSSSRGGKAGRGKNQTLSIQVREPSRPGEYFLKRQYRFKIGDDAAREKAIAKAKTYVDNTVMLANLDKKVVPVPPFKVSGCFRCDGTGQLCNVCGESTKACECPEEEQTGTYACPDCKGEGI